MAACAAGNVGGSQHDGLPQQRRADTAEGPAKPAGRQQFRSSKAVPWDAEVEAAVLQFWTEQGALLPEAEVQPEQQTEQRRTRSKILRWAAKYPQHRNVQLLSDYMAEARAAAADTDWADEPWRVALHMHQLVSRHQRPARVLQRVQAAKQQLAQHGICISRDLSLTVGLAYGKAAGDKAVKLMLALGRLPVSLDIVRVVGKAPDLMHMNSVGAVLERRLAAMQQLHPQLDVAKLCNRQPSLLKLAEETLAANWAALQTASELSDGDTRALVQSGPSLLASDVGVVGWKIRQVRAYEVARNPTAAGRTPVSALARMLMAASFRVWRLCYLSEAKNLQYAAGVWVRMGEADFAARNPGYSLWLASHPIPAEAYKG